MTSLRTIALKMSLLGIVLCVSGALFASEKDVRKKSEESDEHEIIEAFSKNIVEECMQDCCIQSDGINQPLTIQYCANSYAFQTDPSEHIIILRYFVSLTYEGTQFKAISDYGGLHPEFEGRKTIKNILQKAITGLRDNCFFAGELTYDPKNKNFRVQEKDWEEREKLHEPVYLKECPTCHKLTKTYEKDWFRCK